MTITNPLELSVCQ